MAEDVAPGLLHDAEQRQFALRRQPPLIALHDQADRWPILATAIEQQLDRRQQAQLGQCGGLGIISGVGRNYGPPLVVIGKRH